MRKNIKITKRDIKEDKFTAFVFKAKDCVQDNWIYFAGGFALIIVAIVAIAFIQSGQAESTQKAREVFARAESEMRSRNYQLAIVDFKTVVEEYGSTDLARPALFYLGNSYFAAKNYADAKDVFERFLSKYGGSDEYFDASAMAGIAASLAAQGELTASAEKYIEIVDKYPDFKLAGQYLVNAMRNYIKAEDMEGAERAFARIMKDFDDTQYALDGRLLASEYGISL